MIWARLLVLVLLSVSAQNLRANEIVAPDDEAFDTQFDDRPNVASEIAQVWRPVAPTDPEGTCVTSPYGKRHLFGRKLATFHTGLDFRAPSGTPVTAILPGTVISTGRYRACGLYVELKLGEGHYVIYCHLSAYKKFARGQSVERGQVLGLSGTSGSAHHQPHLHLVFTTRAGFAPGYSFDPTPYFPDLAMCSNN